MEMVCLVDNSLICAVLRFIAFIIPWLLLICGFYLGLLTERHFSFKVYSGSPIKLIKNIKKYIRREL